MYTAVLMAALSTSPATPDWRCHCGCFRGCGCYCGCYSGCYCGSYGCYGGMCGCSCFHGCYRSVNFCHSCGCFACYGSCGCYGSYGCYGCHCMGYGYGCWSCFGMPVVPNVPNVEKIPVDPKKKQEELEQTRAQVVVELPTEAKLYIDGHLMKSTSNRRVFATPTLQPGQTYFYDLKAEIVRDGQTVSDTQRVHLRPGQTVRANFGEMTAPAATAQRNNP